MIERLIVDASVFIAAFRPREGQHRTARELLDTCIKVRTEFNEPAHLLPEVLGALARTGSPTIAEQVVRNYREQAELTLLPIDLQLAQMAGDIAVQQKIKGCDAIYIALAALLSIPLVTLAKEQRERAPDDVEVLTPELALAKEWPS